jgi:Lon protease-like protein
MRSWNSGRGVAVAGRIAPEQPEIHEIPLFALNTVLFPGTWLPLRVFEPRYKAMLQNALDGDRTFGIALIKFGEEVAGPSTPFRVGCRASIEEVAEESGQFYLLVRGDRRFEIDSLIEGGNYPRARVRFLAPLAATDADEAAARDLRILHELYVKTLHRAARVVGRPWPPELIAPVPKGNAAVVANWVAAALPVEATEKQRLLESGSVSKMLSEEKALLKEELDGWEAVLRRRAPG